MKQQKSPTNWPGSLNSDIHLRKRSGRHRRRRRFVNSRGRRRNWRNHSRLGHNGSRNRGHGRCGRGRGLANGLASRLGGGLHLAGEFLTDEGKLRATNTFLRLMDDFRLHEGAGFEVSRDALPNGQLTHTRIEFHGPFNGETGIRILDFLGRCADMTPLAFQRFRLHTAEPFCYWFVYLSEIRHLLLRDSNTFNMNMIT